MCLEGQGGVGMIGGGGLGPKSPPHELSQLPKSLWTASDLVLVRIPSRFAPHLPEGKGGEGGRPQKKNEGGGEGGKG